MKPLMRALDAITDAAAWISAALTGLIVLFFWLEVVLRYFFDRPTSWTGPFSQYLMLAVVMLFLPWLTREGHHVAMSFLFDQIPRRFRPALVSAVSGLCAIVCMISAWFCANETLRQFVEDVRSPDAFLFPMWTLSIFLPFGLTLAAVHFLRQTMTGEAPRQYES